MPPPSFEQFRLVYFYDFNTCHCCIYGGWSSLCCRYFPSLLHFRSLRACSMANLRPWRANRRTRDVWCDSRLLLSGSLPEPKVGPTVPCWEGAWWPRAHIRMLRCAKGCRCFRLNFFLILPEGQSGHGSPSAPWAGWAWASPVPSAASRAFLLLAPRGLLARNSFRSINRLATKDNGFFFETIESIKFVNKDLCRRWVRNLIN